MREVERTYKICYSRIHLSGSWLSGLTIIRNDLALIVYICGEFYKINMP